MFPRSLVLLSALVPAWRRAELDLCSESLPEILRSRPRSFSTAFLARNTRIFRLLLATPALTSRRSCASFHSASSFCCSSLATRGKGDAMVLMLHGRGAECCGSGAASCYKRTASMTAKYLNMWLGFYFGEAPHCFLPWTVRITGRRCAKEQPCASPHCVPRNAIK